MQDTVVPYLPDPAIASADMRKNNLPLRWPALMDAMSAPPAPTAEAIAAVARQIGRHHWRGRVDVLDLGSGTGRLLGALAEAYPSGRYAGVEWQQTLVEYARERYPETVSHYADLRTVRLRRYFDLLLCVGNTLASFGPRTGDLARACATFAEHAHPGTLLLIEVDAEVPASTEQAVQLAPMPGLFTGPVQMKTSSVALGARRRYVTRSWRFAHGTVVHDRFKEYGHSPQNLARRLARFGFVPRPDAGHLLVFEFLARPGPASGALSVSPRERHVSA